MAKTKAEPKKEITSMHLAKVPLSELGKYWAGGFKVAPETLGEVVTHFDSQTRTAIIEYQTKRPADTAPVQKVTARRRKRKAN
jgi:hypothetical protein